VRIARAAAALLLGAAALSAACARKNASNAGADTPPSATPIAEVLAAHQRALLALPGVVGIGEGECRGAPCIVVMAATASPELARRIPSTLEGHPVELRVTGTIMARGTFTLSSTAFATNTPIPKKHTCDGADLSPPLSWTDPPAGTKAYALINHDPDAKRAGGWVHWVLYDLPGTWAALPENIPKTDAPPVLGGGRQGKNDFGKTGFNGSCPPPGGPHHYHFTLYALDAPLGLPPGRTRADVEEAMRGHILGTAEVVGLYERR
jgi:Raf kinase inhibitor-like YbhB/YbcL family protein